MDMLIIHGESGTVKTRVRWEAPCPLSETFLMNGGLGGNVGKDRAGIDLAWGRGGRSTIPRRQK